MKRCCIYISGRVQGVSFRSFTKQNAELLGLNGFVKNLDDGRVEVIVEGHEDKIEQLVEKIRQGPPRAKIDDVSVTWEEALGNFKGFDVKL
ncbi:MAG: acylphosphatase [Candidatus Aenigmarchaeota archaeon]|nr:acylphosphatase [Candidatus Aenigmarchaeota archaeon]